MKKFSNVLCKIAYIIAAVILLYLAYNSTHLTYLSQFRADNGYVLKAPDSRLTNLLYIGAVFVGGFIIYKLLFIGAKTGKAMHRRVWMFLIVDLVLVAISLFSYVEHAFIEPYWDQAQVLADAKMFMKGDFSDMTNLYLKKFPQQFGLIFCEVPFLKIWDDFGVFQYMNVVFILAIILLSYLLVNELFENETVNFFTIVAVTAFLPMYVYVSFVYGDIPAVAGCLAIALLIVNWLKKPLWGHTVTPILLSCIFILARENIIIFLIAVAITITVEAIRRKKSYFMIVAVLIVVLPLLSSKLVLKYYEYRGGIQINNPIPSISWIAMGLQGEVEDGTGVGYYNGYNEATWWYQGATKAAAKEYVSKDLKERIEFFKDNPKYAYDFFTFKIQEQWLEPSFDSFYMTVTNSENALKMAREFYSSDGPERVTDFMNRFMSVAYSFAFIYMLYALKHGEHPYEMLMAVAFVGGFLFSIIWEAKGRYTMPYFIFMLVYTANGLFVSCKLLDFIVKKFFIRRKAKRNGELSKECNSNT